MAIHMISLLLLAVVAIGGNAQLTINTASPGNQPPKLVEIKSGNLKVGSDLLGASPDNLVQNVLLRISQQQLTPAELAKKKNVEDQFVRAQTRKQLLRNQETDSGQRKTGTISFSNDLDKLDPKKPAPKPAPGKVGASGLVEIASGNVDLGQKFSAHGDKDFVKKVLGSIQVGQQEYLNRVVQEQNPQRIVQKPQSQLVADEVVDELQEEEQQTKKQKPNHMQQQKQKQKQNQKQKRKPQQQNKNKMQGGSNQFNNKPNQNGKQRLLTANIPGLGRVRGRFGTTQWTGARMLQFFDIPYAQSPVGKFRFKKSAPVKPWTGVLKSNKPHPGCPSLENVEMMMNKNRKKQDLENCLRLTVNTKQLNGSAPVMVYIHGDFLFDGNSVEAAPGYLLEEDVVLVSVRYRLGPFGFLSTMTDDIPGNAAVHDVILALQWIQKYIANFGGDPKRVTLFGQVGGAAMINVLTMSPVVPENLFHRVILQSGSALSPAFTTDNPMPATRDIAKFAGCKDVENVEELNKCLLSLNSTQLLEAYSDHGEAKVLLGIGNYGGAQFVVGGPSGVLPEHPGKLMVADSFKGYPTLGGSVKNAGSFILKDIFMDNFNETIPDNVYDGNAYIEYIINQTNGADPSGAWKKYATEEIFSADDIKNGSFYRMLPGLMDMCSTIGFKNPVLLALQANAKKQPKDTYLYSFDYAGERNRYETLEDDALNMPFDLGVSLTDDNLYLFPWPQMNLISSNRDLKIAKRMIALWTSFATNGVPEAPGLMKWPAMDEDTGPYMKLGTTVSIADNFLDEYTVAVKDAQAGFSLVNADFFESLAEATAAEAEEAKIQEEEEDSDDSDVIIVEGRAYRL